ncbi:putative long-chain-fatty-acid--CoA ligase [Radiomyces spectabilis]|uniref:putative long-chain-fatty-acid--CoA ligase n=1 Tax=Radiomyces spectabilis TaxID=64574 RepID=UPI0022202038|nr:putative long-chain-fatty-acid--CoA ligase [Radiomyces spectabilis]KAI8393624.1 putative long-chain-fatty-acid--CoA ligase [Radiomyces spectabilis]
MQVQKRVNQIRHHLASTDTSSSLRVPHHPDLPPYMTPLNPVRFLLRSAQTYPNKVAVIDGEKKYTYATLAERCLCLANVLLNMGIKKGDRVGILCQNLPAVVEAHYAVPAIGAITVPLNTRLASAEIEYILNHSGTTVLLVQDIFLDQLSEKAKQHLKLIHVADSPNNPYDQTLTTGMHQKSWYEIWVEPKETDTISVNYTSGSTGRPKGVQATYRGGYMTAIADIIHMNLTFHSVFLFTVPMFHCNGWAYPWALVATGGTQVMLAKMDYGVIWKLFEEAGVTHYGGAPTVQAEIINHSLAHRLPRPVTVMVGGSPLAGSVIKRMRALNIHPVHIYGLTETHGPSTVTYEPSIIDHLPESEQYRHLARQGHAMVVTDEMQVVDRDTGKAVPCDGETIGEVCYTGNQLMSGYFRDPEATRVAFRNNMFWSGDLAVQHPDGTIELVDRSKDLIISGGENISSIELENTLMELEPILECAVVAGPDDRWGERPYAFIVIKKGQSLTDDQVIKHCRSRLAGFKCPSKIKFVDVIPRTSTGKIQKFVLRNELWKDRERRIN